jgi:hypothetical protein
MEVPTNMKEVYGIYVYLQSEGAIHPSSMAVHGTNGTSTWYFQWLGTRSTQAPNPPVARHHYCYYRSLKPGEWIFFCQEITGKFSHFTLKNGA